MCDVFLRSVWKTSARYGVTGLLAVASLLVVTNVQAQIIPPPPPSFAFPPTVTSIAPTSGPVSGGTPVTITGIFDFPVARVQFNGTDATSIVRVNGTTITAVTPAQLGPGTATLSVQTTPPSGIQPPGLLFNAFTFTAIPQTVSISVAPASVTEDGAANLIFTVTHDTALPSAVTVNLAFAGTASVGDYAGTIGSVVIPANAASVTFVVDPTADSIVEPDETVIVSVAPSTLYTTGSPSSAMGTILNDDTPSPTIVEGTFVGNRSAGINSPTQNETITGTNFTNVTAVRFGTVPAASFSVVNATTITARPAALTLGDLAADGTARRTVTVVTSAGQATTTSTIVFDGRGPVAAGVPPNVTRSTDVGLRTAIVTYAAPTWTDATNVATQTATGRASGSAFPIGVSTIVFSATDRFNNPSSAQFTVTVVDQELPVFTAFPTNISVGTDANRATAAVTWVLPTATDNSGAATVAQTVGPASGSAFPIGVTTVTYSATDPSGNQVVRSFTVTVADRQSPVFPTAPADITRTTDADLATAVVTFTPPTATDNQPGVVVRQTAGPASGTAFPIGLTRTRCRRKHHKRVVYGHGERWRATNCGQPASQPIV